jgi:ADP-ribose pyrophosphatase YjhB (NUDIX family)
LERAKEPQKGKLDVPGGFCDPGEGIMECLVRECREELGIDLSKMCLGDEIILFASFPNVYPYKGIVYNTCDMFFTVSIPHFNAENLTLQKDEVQTARVVPLDKICLDDLGFESTRRATKELLRKFS